MTTNVLVVQSRPGLLEAETSAGSQRLTAQVQSLAVSGGDEIVLERAEDGEAWIINQGPRTIAFRYTIRDDAGRPGRRVVGPTRDYLPPGGAREVGLGRRVWWHLREAA